jgi:hypothetical protein
MVTVACEFLGLRLEWLPVKGSAYGVPPDLFAEFDCVVASGRQALLAAASGVAVVIADERGSAGLLTAEKLERVLEFSGGAGCFDRPARLDVLLAALSAYRNCDVVTLAARVCAASTESAASQNWLGWLREAGACSTMERPPEGDGAWGRPRFLSISAMAVEAMGGEEGDAGAGAHERLPACELLVDVPPEDRKVAAPPCLPLGRYIPAADEIVQAGFFGKGWSFAESWGRWADAEEAVLRFRPDSPGPGLRVWLHVVCFLPPSRLFQRALVRVNGHPLLCWIIDRKGTKEPFELPLEPDLLDGEEVCQITFHLPDLEAPSAWGAADTRKLGLGLIGIKVTRKGEGISAPGTG